MKRKISERFLYPWKKLNERKLTKIIYNKTILITGASYGIGEKTAYKLAQKSVTLILVARTSEKLHYLKKALEEKGATVYIHATNLQNMEEVDILLEYIKKLPTNIDILINNAGKSINRSFEDSLNRFHDFSRTISLNYYAPIKLTLALAPMLIKSNGQLINISTINTLFAPPPFWSAYVASKSAFDIWVQSIAPELRAKGVAVTSIYPSLVRTRMIKPRKAYDNAPAMLPEQMADIIGKSIISRSSRYAPWWTIWIELGSIIFRKPFEILSTIYVKRRYAKRDI